MLTISWSKMVWVRDPIVRPLSKRKTEVVALFTLLSIGTYTGMSKFKGGGLSSSVTTWILLKWLSLWEISPQWLTWITITAILRLFLKSKTALAFLLMWPGKWHEHLRYMNVPVMHMPRLYGDLSVCIKATHWMLSLRWLCHVIEFHLVGPNSQCLYGILLDVAHQITHQVYKMSCLHKLPTLQAPKFLWILQVWPD